MPARITSPDAIFLSGLNSMVAVYVDVNKTGGSRGPLGGVGPNYQPLSGYEAERCRIVFKRARDVVQEFKPGAISQGRILFGVSIDLDVNNKLVWFDPTTGRTRHLYVDGSSRNAHEQSHHWVCDFTEYVA